MEIPAVLRNRRTIRHLATAAAAVALAVPLAGSAGAQTFQDPAAPCPPGVATPAAPFADRNSIPTAHRLNVDCAFALRIVLGSGGNPNNYNPGRAVTREQMAGFIARGLRAAGYQLPVGNPAGFRDTATSAFRADIDSIAALGITQGVSPGVYDPGGVMTRAQMASFLIRAGDFAYGEPAGGLANGIEPIALLTFSDVAANDVHRANIAAAADLLGLTVGVTQGRYNPGGNVGRDQMATFVVRLVDVTLLNA